MANSEGKIKKWYWTAFGTVLLTIVSDNIAERTKELPLINYLLFPFRWLYGVGARFLTLNIKMWVLTLIVVALYFMRRLFKHLALANSSLPSFVSYTSDCFHIWTWKWSWQKGNDGWMIQNLTPYCSKCDVELGINNFANTARCPACRTEYGYYASSPDFELASDTEKLVRAKATKIASR